MNTTHIIIIEVIVVSWLIALCFKDFRDRCVDYIPEIFSDFYKMYREDDTGNILYQMFLILFVFLVAYPMIIVIIIVSPILCGMAEIYNAINDYYRRKRSVKNEPFTDWQIRQQERERKRKEMEEWRDNHIKTFHYEGKAPFHFDRDTYLYLENAHNEFLNQCIERNKRSIYNQLLLNILRVISQKYGHNL